MDGIPHTSAQVLALVNLDFKAMQGAERRIKDELVGRRVRVKDSSHFNNQPYGRSRKPWKGRESVIRWVAADTNQDAPTVMLEGASCSMLLSDVELL